MIRRVLKWSGIGLVLAFLLIQLVPYGRDHSNPAVTNAIAWDSPRTEQLFYDACADCHSNETEWPWYSNVAPVSWLVQRDVDGGRNEFNISETDGMEEAGEAAETVENGSMPPWFYNLMHAEARLTADEEADLIAGLVATFGSDEEDEGDDD
jgi:hypothetical protein